MSHRLCNVRILTLRGTLGSWWKCGGRTSIATFSKPSSDALPISVIGDKRFANLVRFLCLLSRASLQILRTKETGSTGARVLKNSTELRQQVARSLISTLDLPHWTSRRIGMNSGSDCGFLMPSSSAWISFSMFTSPPSESSSSSACT